MVLAEGRFRLVYGAVEFSTHATNPASDKSDPRVASLSVVFVYNIISSVMRPRMTEIQRSWTSVPEDACQVPLHALYVHLTVSCDF